MTDGRTDGRTNVRSVHNFSIALKKREDNNNNDNKINRMSYEVISVKETICSLSDREQIFLIRAVLNEKGSKYFTVSYFPYKCIYFPTPLSTQISSVDYSKAEKSCRGTISF